MRILGLRRGKEPIPSIGGVQAIELAQSADGKLAARSLAIAQILGRLSSYADAFRDADAIVARNLEMLVIGARAKQQFAPSARLIYECLDIHTLMIDTGYKGRLLRSIEDKCLRHVDALIVSSPAFIQHYFKPRDFRGDVHIVENKIFPPPATSIVLRPPTSPPWRIGWFGLLRCATSLSILSSLAEQSDGTIEVVIRGRPSNAVFPDFAKAVRDLPGINYLGPYQPHELPNIYGEVHFSWAIDFYEKGFNSSWLLPNRIYEGGAHGVVPIALENVQTGRWLRERHVGVRLEDDPLAGLTRFFQTLTLDRFDELKRGLQALPRSTFVADELECRAIVEAMCSN